MSSRIRNTAVDCADPYELARFWGAVLGLPLSPDDEPGDPEAGLETSPGSFLLFLQVPESKRVKNRLHLCLEPDGPREPEVERILGLGASLLDDRRESDGTGWAVLADPEGNEFCVLRSAAERAETKVL